MSALENVAVELARGAWEERMGSLWLAPAKLDIRRMAALMNAAGARLITIAAMELAEGGGIRMDYHWDLDGTLATVTTMADNGVVPSICDLCPAADWIEREIHECFAVEFQGREYEPLLLRPGAAPGVSLRKEDE